MAQVPNDGRHENAVRTRFCSLPSTNLRSNRRVAPILTFASRSNRVVCECQNHKRQWQIYVSSAVFEFDICMITLALLGVQMSNSLHQRELHNVLFGGAFFALRINMDEPASPAFTLATPG